MNAPAHFNPFLTGNFGPIRSEDDFADLPVKGQIPGELRGTLYRTGPNPQFDPRDANHHWFAGDGMVHAFNIADGKVSYLNRYVRTPKWEIEHEAGQSMFGTFGNPMTSDPSVIGKDSGVANTNIVYHAGRLLALEEGHQPFEVDAKTLAPKGYLEYSGKAGRFTAHPKFDPETGEMVFFGYSAEGMPFSDKIVYGVANAQGKVTRLDQFKAPFSSMIHDFFVTKNYTLFPVLPITMSLERAMRGQSPVAWEPEAGAFVGVMARNAGTDTIRWFETDPCYVFHPMNMFEEGSKIFVDVMEYPRGPLFPNVDGTMGEFATATLKRWTFDLASNSNVIKREVLDDMSGEFPRFDERRAGLSYRHGYFAGSTTNDVRFDAIAHIDLKTAKKAVHSFGEGDVTSEPVFVPRSANTAEGDGFIVAVVYRGSENRSDLVVLDAGDVARGPVAVASLPRRVPFGFHGNWVGA
ncbi:MAG TPA: carotenoid oxygenase family protein [Rhizomicrobium sp.]|nr:carotenoid oxygenase family protein [Rhizomicrobium sp.]